MKIAFISHPIGGDVKNDLRKIEKICREINLNESDVVPFVPYFIDCYVLDDSKVNERERGIKNTMEYFHRNLIDEFRLYGDHISIGMKVEILTARKHLIKVRAMTEETKKELQEAGI